MQLRNDSTCSRNTRKRSYRDHSLYQQACGQPENRRALILHRSLLHLHRDYKKAATWCSRLKSSAKKTTTQTSEQTTELHKKAITLRHNPACARVLDLATAARTNPTNEKECHIYKKDEKTRTAQSKNCNCNCNCMQSNFIIIDINRHQHQW